MSHAIIIPIYKKDRRTVELCSKLSSLGAEHIIIVSDGCKKGGGFFNALVSIGCEIVSIDENKGKGASIKAGAKFAHSNIYNLTGFITADADGQHKAEDIMRISRALELRPDNLIIGKRDLKRSKLKPEQRIGNRISSFYFKTITGVKCKDAFTGLRGIPATLYDIVINTAGDRFDYEMNFLTKCADLKIPFYDVSIATDSTKEKETNYHLIKDTYLIYRTPLRFATASLSCTAVDLALFTVFAHLLPSSAIWKVALATLMARVISGSINFLINRKMIFGTDGKASKQAIKFFILFFCIMIASSLIVSLLSFIPIPVTITKAIVDMILWTVNYSVQRKWVFK